MGGCSKQGFPWGLLDGEGGNLGRTRERFATLGGNIMSMFHDSNARVLFSTIKEIYLDSKINSIIYPHLKCIMCYMNDSHLSIFARVARQKFSISGTVLAC